MKKLSLMMLMILCLFLFSGCVSFLPEGFSAYAQEQEGLHSPVAGMENADEFEAQLYFRYLDEPYLTAETRRLTVRKDESTEKALVRALLAGPSAASPELRRLFSDDVTVESTIAQGDLLFVTLSENVLSPMGDEPAAWQRDVAWQREVPLRRQLAMQSLTMTLIENCGYGSVQILLDKRAEANGSMRLPMSYYQQGQEGLAPALRWDDACLLTPSLTARILLESYQQKDWDRAYRYVAARGAQQRPSQAAAGTTMDKWLTLEDFYLGEAVVSPAGDRAIISCEAILSKAPGDVQQLEAHPLRLMRENGIWKIDWSEFEKLLNRW